MQEQGFGRIQIKLLDLIEARGISKNKLAHKAEMNRSQLNQYCNNAVARVDLAVVARLCTALDCKIEDILEFIPADSK